MTLGLLDDRSILVRAVCGRDGENLIMFEIRVGYPGPNAAILRRIKSVVDMLVEFEERHGTAREVK
jgi:hypothetical protein